MCASAALVALVAAVAAVTVPATGARSLLDEEMSGYGYGQEMGLYGDVDVDFEVEVDAEDGAQLVSTPPQAMLPTIPPGSRALDDSCVATTGECVTIGDYVKGEPMLSSYVAALESVEIFELAMDPPEPHTMLAPNNNAFAAIAAVTADLAADDLLNILLLHVLEGAFPSAALSDGMTIPTHVPDANLTVGIANDGTATFTGPYDGSVATVVVADVKACNGNIVHVLDTVLQQGPDAPPKPVVQDGSDGSCITVGDYAGGNAELASFVETLSAAGVLEDASNPPEPHTILAPTNAALAAVADVTAGLEGQELWPILLLHVLEGGLPAAALTDGMKVETHIPDGNLTVGVAASTVTFTAPYGGSTATVVTADVETCNGNIVHVIDTVLVMGPDAPPVDF